MTEAPELARAFHRVAEERRSVRDFLPDPVPDEVLERCLDSARRAPSSSNLQPWEFVVIRDAAVRAEANRVCLDQRLLRSAPLLVAVVARRGTWRRHSRFILDTLHERGIQRRSQERYWGQLMPVLQASGPFGLVGALKKAACRLVSLFRPSPNLHSGGDLRVQAHKSTALAAATFMLALRSEGYDSCPLEGFDPWRARKLLGLPRGAEVCMFVAVGKRSEKGLWWERMLVPREWVVREV